MTEDRIQQIEQVIAAVEGQGLPWSNRTIFEQVGGNYEGLARYLKARRAESRQAECRAVDVEAEAPPAPLPVARLRRAQTAQAEHALALHEQDLKRERHALENQANQLRIHQQTARTDAADLTRRHQEQAVARQLAQVEAQRQQVHGQRRAASEASLAAQDAYADLATQARRWLRRLRQAQREAQTSTGAFYRGEAREELAEAFTQLQALVGPAEAETLAADPTLQPAWLKD